MGNPHDFGDGRATHEPYVPALDALRGLAAILVAGAHYVRNVVVGEIEHDLGSKLRGRCREP